MKIEWTWTLISDGLFWSIVLQVQRSVCGPSHSSLILSLDLGFVSQDSCSSQASRSTDRRQQLSGLDTLLPLDRIPFIKLRCRSLHFKENYWLSCHILVFLVLPVQMSFQKMLNSWQLSTQFLDYEYILFGFVWTSFMLLLDSIEDSTTIETKRSGFSVQGSIRGTGWTLKMKEQKSAQLVGKKKCVGTEEPLCQILEKRQSSYSCSAWSFGTSRHPTW